MLLIETCSFWLRKFKIIMNEQEEMWGRRFFESLNEQLNRRIGRR